MKGFPDLPPLWLLLFLALNWGLSVVLPGPLAGALGQSVGWGLIALGLGLIFWAAFWFWSRKTTIEPHHAPQSLIVEGPFRWSRNPIYLGMLFILTGSVAYGGQPLGLIFVGLFLWVLNVRFAGPEEQGLRAAFGEDAEHYLAATRRWL